MSRRKFVCPSCGRRYFSLFLRSATICPSCGSRVASDLKAIGVLEMAIGGPILWLLAAALRTLVDDGSGMLAYSLLLVPAVIVHVLVLDRFATATRVEDRPENE
jgi:uncharacterized protein (DUF983 family)